MSDQSALMEAVAETGAAGEEPGPRKPPPGPRLRVRWQQAKLAAHVAVLRHCAEQCTAAALCYTMNCCACRLSLFKSVKTVLFFLTAAGYDSTLGSRSLLV